jgi:flagellar protein FlgJ
MDKKVFIHTFLPAAEAAGVAYQINPDIILAQAAVESGWGESNLAVKHFNFFGIMGYGRPSAHWSGSRVDIRANQTGGKPGLMFRTYPCHEKSFLDFARLIREVYPVAAALSFNPKAYAKEIAYSPYISEVNGDNREAYQRLIASVCRSIVREREIMALPNSLQSPVLASV